MEEENTEQTYAYELTPNSEKLLKIKKAEIKELRKKANRDKIVRLANAAQKRVIRDEKLDRINLKLRTIKSQMVYYNRAGKVERNSIDILANIIDLINNDVELAEEIERSRPNNFLNDEKARAKLSSLGVDFGKEDTPVSQEDIEGEAVDVSEVSPPGN